ncbi:MAG TPA: imidazole glycerol phosphate synthase subunit HisH [Mycobacteriales bacterium]|jgi:glutamine amidotransferase|nr:imidazole glycerol phosphate synthase subunit HisH [Mycobacteriales bacterium]
MRTPRVVVLDYGSGNLRSAERALARTGADVEVTADLDAAREADGLVVPGVGAFAACMAAITDVGGHSLVRERLAADRPVLGICVGMQVMFERGDEHGVVTEGIGVLPGEVRRLTAERVPHMGWNTVAPPPDSVLFDGLDDGTRFYFVHSYAVGTADRLRETGRVTVTEHGGPFVAAVEQGALAVTQFHPEKSGDAGATVLANWVETLR